MYKHPDSEPRHLPHPRGTGGTSTSTAPPLGTHYVEDDSPRCWYCWGAAKAGWERFRCPMCTAVASPAGCPDPDLARAHVRGSVDHGSENVSSSPLTSEAGLPLKQRP